MPDKIKPSEVSEVLFRELQDIQDDIQYEEVGSTYLRLEERYRQRVAGIRERHHGNRIQLRRR